MYLRFAVISKNILRNKKNGENIANLDIWELILIT